MSDAVETTVSTEAAPSAEPSTETKAPEAPSEPKRYKISVEGEEFEADEQQLLKFAQLGKASTKRFEEAKRMKEEATSLKDRLKSDWAGTLKELGLDPRQVTEGWLAEQIRLEMMDPKDRALHDKEQEAKTYKQKVEEFEKAKELEKHQAEVARYEAQLEKELPGALEKTGLPKTPASLRRIAGHLLNAMEGGYDMSVEEAAELARDDIQRDLKELLGSASKYDHLIPESVAEKLMQSHLSKVKTAPAFKAEPKSEPAAPAKGEKKFVSPAEWRKMFS
jgi:hypothetical protein